MNTAVILPTSFPVTSLPDEQDVVTLAQNKDWLALNNVIVCQDSDSKVTARFGQNTWNISPYIAGSKANAKPIFDFSAFTNAPLLLELKLIVYGWLFHKSGKVNKPAKISTLTTRFFCLKKVYGFLHKSCINSLSALANKTIWSKFEAELINQQFTQRTIENYFIAINTVLILQSWLKVDFGFTAINASYLSKKLSNKTEQQTLVIPERLSDAIYGKAIELVEQGDLYHQQLIAVMDEIQTNYSASKKIVDHKIQSKKWKYLTDQHGQITNSRNYYREIQKRLPLSIKDIVKRHLANIDELSHIYDGNDFQRYYGQLITACYICCGAFSGMRDSELAELTPQSYFRETFEGREFHMLQSRTFKFGEKDETWVAAPIAEKAINLATKLTQQ